MWLRFVLKCFLCTSLSLWGDGKGRCVRRRLSCQLRLCSSLTIQFSNYRGRPIGVGDECWDRLCFRLYYFCFTHSKDVSTNLHYVRTYNSVIGFYWKKNIRFMSDNRWYVRAWTGVTSVRVRRRCVCVFLQSGDKTKRIACNLRPL